MKRWIVPWPYLDFWDRLGVAVQTYPAVNRRGVLCALMSYSAARRRLGSRINIVQAQFGGPIPHEYARQP